MEHKIIRDSFLQDLLKLYEKNEDILKEKYDRSLSFQDGIFDRWERAKKLNFGKNASIYNSALIYGTVRVGDETWVGPYVILDGSGGYINIGCFCSIAAGVHIYTHDTVTWALTAGKGNPNNQPVTIEDCCYIGAQSIIKPGVIIGKHSVVGANTFVNKNVDPYTIIAGNPAKKIGEVIIDKDNNVELKYFKKT